MEVADTHGVDRDSDQLFLASGNGCELGAWSVLSRAARNARMDVSTDISYGRAAGRLFSDERVSELVRQEVEQPASTLTLIEQSQTRSVSAGQPRAAVSRSPHQLRHFPFPSCELRTDDS